LIGALLALLALTPVFLGGRALRRRMMPELTGPVATLAEIVLDLSLVVGVTELLGTIGAFKLLPVAVTLGAVGLAAMRAGRVGSGTESRASEGSASASSGVPPAHTPTHSARTTRTWRWATIVAVSVVGAEWMSLVADSWNRGMSTPDTLWYHLPIAARFVQDGWTSRLHFVDAGSSIAFYPATSELLHATGMLFLGNDMLSLVLNLGWLSLALFAAWCIGRRFGVAHVTLIGAATVLAAPQVVLDDAGSGLNDIVGVALFLAAVALISNAVREQVGHRERRAEMLCGALAAGLAVGSKYTLVLPFALLALAVMLLNPRGERVRITMEWLAVAGLAGGYWYVRNFVATGNPVPSAKLGFGPLHLPSIPGPTNSTVAHFVLRGDAWRTYFLPGLHAAFGPAWWGIAVATAASIVLGAVMSNERAVRILAFIVFGCLIAFVFTPQVLGMRKPIYFEPNARYVLLALLMGTVVLPILLRRWHRLVSAVLVAYLVILAATQFAPSLWRHAPTGWAPVVEGAMPNVVGICFGILVVVLGVLWRAERRPRLRWSEHRVAFVMCAAAAIGGIGVEV
jgi:hypothetical protein